MFRSLDLRCIFAGNNQKPVGGRPVRSHGAHIALPRLRHQLTTPPLQAYESGVRGGWQCATTPSHLGALYHKHLLVWCIHPRVVAVVHVAQGPTSMFDVIVLVV